MSFPQAQAAPASSAATTRRPAVGDQWDYLIGTKVTSTASNGNNFVSLDLFDTDASVISGLKANGVFVACYFSAGTYENWRPDKAKFQKKDMGKALPDWPGEKWLNTKSQDVRSIMLSRMDLAVQKGCDGLDPDNLDAWTNKNGLKLTKADASDYVTFLANAAHSKGLLIGLKNAGDIIPQVISLMDYSINEQCHQYNECNLYQPFIKAGKPVFNVEYPKGDSTNNTKAVKNTTKYCTGADSAGFSIILKNINLDSWIQRC